MNVDSTLSPPLGSPTNERFAKPLQFIEEMTENADKVQEKVLSEILAQNGNTEYLQRFNLGGAKDRDTFKSRVPVVTYEDLQPEIQRIANGDRSPIICSHPISEFFTSSGTSGGESKLIPTIPHEMERQMLFRSLVMPVMNLYIPGLDKGKALYFMFIMPGAKTPGGLVARPLVTSFYQSDHFKNRPYDPYNVYTSPDEAILCPDHSQSMYTQMLCGLVMRHEVLRVGSVFTSGLLRAIKFLQQNWRQLAHDISTGSLNPRVTDLSIKARMSGILKPNPRLAELIVAECEGENWEMIIPRIWPNAKYLDAIATGTMAQYIPLLDFYSGGLPISCALYASSECHFGLNLKPMTKPSQVSYTIMPNMAYFEFIPAHPNPNPNRLVDLADLEVGKEYELVVTTYSGLCRYRVGDILRVTEFHNSAPQFKFVRRENVLLSIDSDKTDESELQRAVQNASDLLLKDCDATVLEYTSYADTSTIPGHYVIYLELQQVKGRGPGPRDDVLAECCLVMEESMNSVYRQCRAVNKSVGPLEIRVVRNGTFEELMDYSISRGASISQYKVPRCVSFEPVVELLDARVVSAHLSRASPRWAPMWAH